MSIHNEVPLEYKECHFEAADTYAPAFKSILLDVVAADTSQDLASGDTLMKLFVFACMSMASSERSVSSLLLSAQSPRREALEDPRQRASGRDGPLPRSLGETAESDCRR